MSADGDTKDLRQHTDDSLRAERERSDEEIIQRSDALVEDTGQLIQKARERANAILSVARGREDKHLDKLHAAKALRATIERERRSERATSSCGAHRSTSCCSSAMPSRSTRPRRTRTTSS